jgi:predicted glutamine amidotransferase
MCRWNAYVGQPLVIGELLYRTRHGLIDESLHSRMGAETTNGDGFGVGWYLERDRALPARYRNVNPAWNDANLRELADHIESPLFLAHIRAAVGSPVQQTNCHPFRHGRWLFVHNGLLAGFQTLRRDLLLEVDPAFFDGIAGSTDSELLFHLSASSRPRLASAGSRIRSRGPSGSATASGYGRSATPRSTNRAPSSSPRTWTRCGGSTRRTRGSSISMRATASWSRSPSPIWPAPGSRSPSPRVLSSRTADSSNCRSGLARPPSDSKIISIG